MPDQEEPASPTAHPCRAHHWERRRPRRRVSAHPTPSRRPGRPPRHSRQTRQKRQNATNRDKTMNIRPGIPRAPAHALFIRPRFNGVAERAAPTTTALAVFGCIPDSLPAQTVRTVRVQYGYSTGPTSTIARVYADLDGWTAQLPPGAPSTPAPRNSAVSHIASDLFGPIRNY
jgi:hypothetical protein